MNIAFFFSLQNVFTPKKPIQYQEEINFGISLISSVLKEHGHATRLFILTRETRDEEVWRFLDTFVPSVACFSAVATEFDFIASWAQKVRRRCPNVYRLGGGCHISLNPAAAENEGFDAICVGEGEYPVLELVTQLSQGEQPHAIKNLWITTPAGVEKNETRPFLEDLDQLPFPDRDMWREWVAEHGSRPSILLGRGCPFQCSYCSNEALRRCAPGRYVRFRSPENILAELNAILQYAPDTEEVYFEVETFAANMKWALTLCEQLVHFNETRNDPVSFGCNLRIVPNVEWAPLFYAMKKANFRFVNIGLESGSERVRSNVLNRHYANENVIEAVDEARNAGLQIRLFNMIGLPHETEADIRQTVHINRRCQPDMRGLPSIFFPYPGTEIYEMCRRDGLLPAHIDGRRERSRPVLKSNVISRRTIERYYVWFDYLVYRGRKPLSKLLAYAFVARLHSSYWAMRLYRVLSELGPIKYVKQCLKRG